MHKTILIAALLLAGCASPEASPETALDPPGGPAAEPRDSAAEAPPAETPAADTAATPGIEATTAGCHEMCSWYPFPADEYAGAMPDGFSLDLDGGDAVILVISRDCDASDHHLVGVLVQPPEDRRRDAARHVLLMDDVWTQDAHLDAVLDAADATHVERSFTMQGHSAGAGSAVVFTSEPDWVIEVKATGAIDDTPVVRYFGAYWDDERQQVVATGAFDTVRVEAASISGPATAHSLPLVDGALLPFDQVGQGSVVEDLVDVTWSLA